ncbi:PREDICTED: uncharacterized protein LOC108756739 [Trachymyrmex septentrionalis]|uniref:uncharacterized protein LOC108756739 n=1 Tax=Trachymyrmex septentrionalis TaxID=34720 RepID=UPI00084F6556|nr:PREDICTED: uncharacterized protein LOC108756739 [Trachymyrmex septentrionalis]
MLAKATLLILLSLAFTSNGCIFSKRSKTCTHRSDDECICATTVRYNPLTDTNITVDPHCDCRSTGFGVVRIIPYGTCIADACGTIHVDLSSACVRCAMCMAIAEKINQTLLEVHDIMMPDDWLNETETVLLLRTICDYSFQHYGLREIDGKKFISDPLPGDKLVISSANGLWEKNLRNMCHNFLDEIQELQLYRNWKEWCEDDEHIPNLEDILCRNEISSLRDCRGISNVYKRQVPTIFGARVKFLAEYI